MGRLLFRLPLALVLASPGAGAAQPVIFGAGTISKPGDNVYRGRFSPDGREFWFFRKVDPDAEEYRIHVARRSGDGWGEPERVTFGGEHSDMYPTPTPDGRALVFTSYRPFPDDTAGHRNANLWYVERRGEGWGEPVPMRGASTPANYESGPWFGGDGALHFRSTSPDWRSAQARRIAPEQALASAAAEHDPLTDPWTSFSPRHHLWGGVSSPDGSLVVLDVSALDAGGRRGPSDLWIVVRRGEGWSDPQPLDGTINTPDAYENFVAFTPDGATLLFVRGFATYYAVPVPAAR